MARHYARSRERIKLDSIALCCNLPVSALSKARTENSDLGHRVSRLVRYHLVSTKQHLLSVRRNSRRRCACCRSVRLYFLVRLAFTQIQGVYPSHWHAGRALHTYCVVHDVSSITKDVCKEKSSTPRK